MSSGAAPNTEAPRPGLRPALVPIGAMLGTQVLISLAVLSLSVLMPAVARARKLEKAYAEAEAQGLGAINVDGVMVDVASIRILRNTVLNKADLYGM